MKNQYTFTITHEPESPDETKQITTFQFSASDQEDVLKIIMNFYSSDFFDFASFMPGNRKVTFELKQDTTG